MNRHTRRAMVLYRQSRFSQAADEFRVALAEDQQEAYAAAMLAVCLARQGEYLDATEQAKSAIGINPELAATHYALSVVMRLRRRYEEALAAISEAIRLEANDPEYHRAAAQAYILLNRHDPALASATRAYELDPYSHESANLKAFILLNSNRAADAQKWMQAALSISPNNAMLQANAGWSFAQGGQPNEALEHFRVALRLDPTLEWAREGTLFALRSQYLLYRLGFAVNVAFWKLPRVIIVVLLTSIALSCWMVHQLRSSSPELSDRLLPVMIGFVALPVAFWATATLLNLLLLFDSFARNLLTRDQLAASTLVGVLLLAVIALVTVAWSFDATWAWWAALTFALAMSAVAVTYRCEQGRPRKSMAAITLLLFAFGMGLAVLSASANFNAIVSSRGSPLEKFFNAGFFVSALASQLAPFTLAFQRVAR